MILEEGVYLLPDGNNKVWLDKPLTAVEAETRYQCLQLAIRMGVIRILKQENPTMHDDEMDEIVDRETVVLGMDINDCWKEPLWHCRTGILIHVNGPAQAGLELWKNFYLNPDQAPVSKKRSDIAL